MVPPTGRPDEDRKAQDEKIAKIEAIVGVAAENRAEETTPDSGEELSSQQEPEPSGSASSFLDHQLHDLCSVELATTPQPQLTSKERVRDELRHYFAFECNTANVEDPLAWWKVSMHRNPHLRAITNSDCF
jgi:hypothetical protein